jgi:hypothetical protein
MQLRLTVYADTWDSQTRYGYVLHDIKEAPDDVHVLAVIPAVFHSRQEAEDHARQWAHDLEHTITETAHTPTHP